MVIFQYNLFYYSCYPKGVNNMENKANKTFLDTLLDDTQQNTLSSLYALEPTHNGVNQRAIYEAQDVNTSITGTDEDDTIHITGNLTANNADHQTLIDLKGGNNTVNIDGKILARNDEYIFFEGRGSTNSITVSGIEAIATKYNGSYNEIQFGLYGRDVNSLHVKGDIFSHGVHEWDAPGINVYMYNDNFDKLSNNYILIDGNIFYQNGDNIDFYSEGYENQYTIKGSVILDNFDRFLAEETGVYNDLSIGDSLFITNTLAQIMLSAYNSDNPETSYSTFQINGQLHVSDKGTVNASLNTDVSNIEIGSVFVEGSGSSVSLDVFALNPDAATQSTTVINGNIEAHNGGSIVFSNGIQSNNFEVKGQIISQSDSIVDPNHNTSPTYSDIEFYSAEDANTNSTYNFLGGILNNNGGVTLEGRYGNERINITGDVTTQGVHFSDAVTGFSLGGGDDTFTLVGNLFADTHGINSIGGQEGNDTFSIKGNVSAKDEGRNELSGGEGDDTFTIVGNLFAGPNGVNSILAGEGNDIISIKGNVSVKDDGKNELSGGAGDDTFILNGHIDAGALAISGDDGNDTLVLTANSNNNFEVNYKDWLTDFSSTNSLVHSNIENIRLDVDRLQIGKLGWFTDIINKANADGAHITVTDKIGHQVVNPTTYLAQGNDTHNPINDVLDHYAPATANAAQPKAFAEHVAAPSTDAFTAPHFDNNNFLHEMEQQAQAHAAAAA